MSGEQSRKHAVGEALQNFSLESFGGTVATIVSAAFYFPVGLINLVSLGGIVRVFKGQTSSHPGAAQIPRHAACGLASRCARSAAHPAVQPRVAPAP